MPKKRPASQWQPAGIELLDVSSLYGDAKICELAVIIGSLRGEKLRRHHRFHFGDDALQGMAVIGISGQRLGVECELTTL